MIGVKLRKARAASGWSLRELAKQLDDLVTAQAIGKYERNEDMPSSKVFMALAQALNVSLDYLLRDDALALDGIEFRKRSKSIKEEATIEARTLLLMERYLAVEEMLGLNSVDWAQPRNHPFQSRDYHDAEDAARTVREEWGLGTDPIPRLAELLEERGIKVLAIDLESIDGLAAKVLRRDQHAARVIVIRHNTWSERKRFSLAHELGHMMLEVGSEVDPEKAANRFAGAFLMPADSLRAEIGHRRRSISIGELTALKSRFGVSLQALTYRCKDLGIINQSTFAQLFKTFADRGWRSEPFEEPGSLPPEYEHPKRFERLCYRALAERIIGESKATELLGIDVNELNARLNQEPI